ncbi:TetR family transcriptional regulator [Gorillibacterium sp. CAU 1737]|uniref:TetR/AcrR family transcriptional regulator n=1 Tax=Gorillibacterium sp. CAU 1737 TaxID=3140362 RepID=UPI00326103B7
MTPKLSEDQREDKRRQILQSAIQVFSKRGYKSVTMKDVVEESGLSRGGVYLYFSSTDEMLLAILDDIDNRDEQFFQQAGENVGSCWSAIVQLLGGMAATQEEDSLAVALMEFFLDREKVEERRQIQIGRYERVRAFVETFLAKGTERGEFRPLLPLPTLARMIISFTEGVHIDSLLIGHEPLHVQEQAEGFQMTLRHLLQVQNPEEAS